MAPDAINSSGGRFRLELRRAYSPKFQLIVLIGEYRRTATHESKNG
jgi:hypothetical protein